MQLNKSRKSLPLELINEIYANLPVPEQCQLLFVNSRVYGMSNETTKRNLKTWKREFANFTRMFFGDEEYYRILRDAALNNEILGVRDKKHAHLDLDSNCGKLQSQQQSLIDDIAKNIEMVRKHFHQKGYGDHEFEKTVKERNFMLSYRIEYLSMHIHKEGCFLKMWDGLQRNYVANANGQQSNDNKNSFNRQLMNFFQKRRLIFGECQEMMAYVDMKMDEWKMAIGK